VIAVGTQRIRVDGWLDDDPYPLAQVSPWLDQNVPSEQTALTPLIETVRARVNQLNALATELGESVADATTEIFDNAVAASYQLCALAPIGPSDQQRLLGAEGPLHRLEMLLEVLEDVAAMLEFRRLNSP
jgi:uncharacterized protein